MEATHEAEWPDEFTREEMLEQQSRLLIEELRLLQDEVSRQRKNIAKLIDMNSEVTKERDALRIDLAKALLKAPGDDDKLITFNIGGQF